MSTSGAPLREERPQRIGHDLGLAAAIRVPGGRMPDAGQLYAPGPWNHLLQPAEER